MGRIESEIQYKVRREDEKVNTTFQSIEEAYRYAVTDQGSRVHLFFPYEPPADELELEEVPGELVKIEGRLEEVEDRDLVALTVGNRSVVVPRHTAFQPEGLVSVSTNGSDFFTLIVPFAVPSGVHDRGIVWLDLSYPDEGPIMQVSLLPNHGETVEELMKSHQRAQQAITRTLKTALDYDPSKAA